MSIVLGFAPKSVIAVPPAATRTIPCSRLGSTSPRKSISSEASSGIVDSQGALNFSITESAGGCPPQSQQGHQLSRILALLDRRGGREQSIFKPAPSGQEPQDARVESILCKDYGRRRP